MSFGANVELCIDRKALKKCKVAAGCGIPISRFSKIIHEKTEPNATEILSICDFLGETPNEMLGYPRK